MTAELERKRRVGTLYWLLAFGQAVHSIEEMRTGLYDFFWTMTGVVHNAFPSFPQFRWDAVTFAVVNMGIITFGLGIAPFVREGRGWAVGLAAVVAVVETFNGIAHIAAAFYFGGYVPGVASAPLLLLLGVTLLRELWRRG
ncbi:MAG: HXXEE domain-containing protein [Acidobacteria bacterium]|nr:HXXEE domain-containing protein [Acidobacteriota bacterium]